MKLNAISESGMRVAHVGVSSDPDSDEQQIWGDADSDHLDAAFMWLYNRGEHELLYDRDDDFIDLNDGRDFLKEGQKYDIVILHFVYDPPRGTGWRTHGPSIYTVSTRHSPANWKTRLVNTGARYIFTFGDYGEVSGKYLKRIPGYDGPIKDDRNPDMQVYIKNEI